MSTSQDPDWPERAGRGLIGIGERIAACGGKVTAGVGPDGSGFRVSATLPV